MGGVMTVGAFFYNNIYGSTGPEGHNCLLCSYSSTAAASINIIYNLVHTAHMAAYCLDGVVVDAMQQGILNIMEDSVPHMTSILLQYIYALDIFREIMQRIRLYIIPKCMFMLANIYVCMLITGEIYLEVVEELGAVKIFSFTSLLFTRSSSGMTLQGGFFMQSCMVLNVDKWFAVPAHILNYSDIIQRCTNYGMYK
ncbi:hypothetical protein ACJX0J_032686 [Zea mays]